MRFPLHNRARWIIAIVIATIMLAGCAGLAVGFIIGNLFGEDHVCGQVYDHAENPEDVPVCNDPWW